MNLKIGSVIKKLREKNNTTQEILASYLDVTPQAISRWESGTCYPDIEILPKLAVYFSVSTDELLGINPTEREKRLKEIHSEINYTYEIAKFDEEEIQKARIFLAEYPADRYIQTFLAQQITNVCCKTEKPDKNLMKEAEAQLLTLIENSESDSTFKLQQRSRYIKTLAFLYAGSFKDKDKLNHALDMLSPLDSCREAVAASISKMTHDQKDMQTYIGELTIHLQNELTDYIISEMPDESETLDLKIEMLGKIPELIEFVYGKDMLLHHYYVGNIFRYIAAYKILQGKNEEALDYLDKMCDRYISASKAKIGDKFASPFVNELCFLGAYKTKHNIFYHILHNKLSQERYDPIRKDKRFKAIIKRMQDISEIKWQS